MKPFNSILGKTVSVGYLITDLPGQGPFIQLLTSFTLWGYPPVSFLSYTTAVTEAARPVLQGLAAVPSLSGCALQSAVLLPPLTQQLTEAEQVSRPVATTSPQA